MREEKVKKDSVGQQDELRTRVEGCDTLEDVNNSAVPPSPQPHTHLPSESKTFLMSNYCMSAVKIKTIETFTS